MRIYVREFHYPFLTPEFMAPDYDYVAVLEQSPAGDPDKVQILSATIYGSPDSGVQQAEVPLGLIRGMQYRLIPWKNVPPAWQDLFQPFKDQDEKKEMD